MRFLWLLAILIFGASPDPVRAQGTQPFSLSPESRQEIIKREEVKQKAQTDAVASKAPSFYVTRNNIHRLLPRFTHKIYRQKASSIEALFKELTPHLGELSNQTQWEFCGEVSYRSSDNSYALWITTVKSSLFCPPIGYTEEGFVNTGAVIHTHPTSLAVLPTMWERWVREDPSKMVLLDPNGFSDQDLTHPNMWLVAPNGDLLHSTLTQAPHSHLSLLFTCPYRSWSF